MITIITKDGVLLITPTTQLESYALKQWCKENIIDGQVVTMNNIIINTETKK